MAKENASKQIHSLECDFVFIRYLLLQHRVNVVSEKDFKRNK